MSNFEKAFDGWIAHALSRNTRFVIAPRDYWNRHGRTLDGNPGGDIPGFTYCGYELTPTEDNKNPLTILEFMGFEIRR